jgi:hypothetical protein
MRAFMSTPGDKPIYYEGDTLAYADGSTFKAPHWERDAVEAIRLATYAAEREARAILAETEPEKSRPAGWAGLSYLAHAALADTLTAFVAEGEWARKGSVDV